MTILHSTERNLYLGLGIPHQGMQASSWPALRNLLWRRRSLRTLARRWMQRLVDQAWVIFILRLRISYVNTLVYQFPEYLLHTFSLAAWRTTSGKWAKQDRVVLALSSTLTESEVDRQLILSTRMTLMCWKYGTLCSFSSTERAMAPWGLCPRNTSIVAWALSGLCPSYKTNVLTMTPTYSCPYLMPYNRQVFYPIWKKIVNFLWTGNWCS